MNSELLYSACCKLVAATLSALEPGLLQRGSVVALCCGNLRVGLQLWFFGLPWTSSQIRGVTSYIALGSGV